MQIGGSQQLALATVLAPVLWNGRQGPDVASGIGAIFAWQREQPPQAPSLFSIVQPFTAPPIVSPGVRSVLLSQEIPWHPQAPFTFIPSSFTSPAVTKKAEWIIRYRRRGRR